MAFAVIETGGKQYRVSPGSVVEVEYLDIKEGSEVSFDHVLVYQNSEVPVLGNPFIAGVLVKAEVVAQIKGDKIRVFTYKPKKRQRRTLGHRQLLTQVKITEIVTPEKASKKKDEAA